MNKLIKNIKKNLSPSAFVGIFSIGNLIGLVLLVLFGFFVMLNSFLLVNVFYCFLLCGLLFGVLFPLFYVNMIGVIKINE